MRRKALTAALVLAGLTACGVSVRSDRSAIGGGPAQATAQARAVFQQTVVAAATTTALTSAEAPPCECEATGK